MAKEGSTGDGMRMAEAVGASVEDQLQAAIAEAVWESRVLAGTVSGNTPKGTGSLHETVDLSVGAVLEYTLIARVDPAAVGWPGRRGPAAPRA